MTRGGTARCMLRIAAAACTAAGCAAGAATGEGASSAAEARAEPYALDGLEGRLAELARAAKKSPGAARRSARMRADLVLHAHASKDAELARTLARTYGSDVRRACRPAPREPSALADGCIPTLLASSASALRAHEGEARYARLLETVSEGWNDRRGTFFAAIREAWDRDGHVSVAASVLAWAVGFEVLKAVRRTPAGATVRVLAGGLGFECPRVLARVSMLPAERRNEALERAECLPRCPERSPCRPRALGLRTDLGLRIARDNFAAWITARSVHWLVHAYRVLKDANDRLARTLAAQDVLARIDAQLGGLRIPVPPPVAFDAGPAGRLEVPRWAHGRLPWIASPVYALVAGGALHLGVAPAVARGDGGARITATPFPGTKVPEPERDGSLTLERDASPLARALAEVRAGEPGSFGRAPRSVLLLADRDASAQRVLRAAARLDRTLGVDVHIAVRASGDIGVLQLPKTPEGTSAKGDDAAPRLLLHVTAKGYELTGPDGPVSGTGGGAPQGAQTAKPRGLLADLAQARRLLPDVEALRLSVGPKAPYARFVDVLGTVGGKRPPRFSTIRLAATGLEVP